jgi:hypothetical protein
MDNITLWILLFVVMIIMFDCVCGSGGNGRKREGFDGTATIQPETQNSIPTPAPTTTTTKVTPFSHGFTCNFGTGVIPTKINGNQTTFIQNADKSPKTFATKSECDVYIQTPTDAYDSTTISCDYMNVNETCTNLYNTLGVPLPPPAVTPMEFNNSTTTTVDLTWLGWCLYCISCLSPICICLLCCSSGATLFSKRKGE